MPKPGPNSRRYSIHGTTTNTQRLGPMEPRENHLMPEPRYQQTCITCGGPRGRSRWLKCIDCEGMAA